MIMDMAESIKMKIFPERITKTNEIEMISKK
jgi:hypothetical protein